MKKLQKTEFIRVWDGLGVQPSESACLACMRPWIWSPVPQKKKKKKKSKRKEQISASESRFFLFLPPPPRSPFCHTGVWAQGLVLARQAFYLLKPYF
jgi:hypothetical protein